MGLPGQSHLAEFAGTVRMCSKLCLAGRGWDWASHSSGSICTAMQQTELLWWSCCTTAALLRLELCLNAL